MTPKEMETLALQDYGIHVGKIVVAPTIYIAHLLAVYGQADEKDRDFVNTSMKFIIIKTPRKDVLHWGGKDCILPYWLAEPVSDSMYLLMRWVSLCGNPVYRDGIVKTKEWQVAEDEGGNFS